MPPAWALPERRGWQTAGMVSFVALFYLSWYLALLWDGYLARYQLVELSGLGVAGGTLAGLLVFELGIYAWPRLLNQSDFLWRGFHPMHHSAERLDTFGAFYFNPLDMIGFTLLGSLCLALGVGVAPPQAATAIQRPESHAIHHRRGIHAYNYSDLPLFDILFRTFRSPWRYLPENGFYPGASRRIIDVLLWRDVSEPETEAGDITATTG